MIFINLSKACANDVIKMVTKEDNGESYEEMDKGDKLDELLVYW
jgi:hypothetical protein